MYTLQGKPDQHATHNSRSVRVWSQIIRISRGQRIATFHEIVNRFIQIHNPLRRRDPNTIHSSMVVWSVGPYPPSLTQQPMRQWEKTILCGQPATRLTGPITLTCDRYVQYLLAGANLSVLNRHRRGLQPWMCRLFTYHSPTFPTNGLPFPPMGPTWSPV
jgi:hypothetical protein